MVTGCTAAMAVVLWLEQDTCPFLFSVLFLQECQTTSKKETHSAMLFNPKREQGGCMISLTRSEKN